MAATSLNRHFREASAVVEGRGVFSGFAEPREAVGNPRLLNKKGRPLWRTFASQHCAQLSMDTPFQHSHPHQGCIPTR